MTFRRIGNEIFNLRHLVTASINRVNIQGVEKYKLVTYWNLQQGNGQGFFFFGGGYMTHRTDNITHYWTFDTKDQAENFLTEKFKIDFKD
jgi:hypothetical protein